MEKEFEHRITEVEERAKSNSHRLEKVEKKQDEFGELVASVRVLAEREQTVESDVKEIKDDVKTLTNKPAKRWNELVDKIILTVVAAIIGLVLGKIGL